MRGSCPRRSRSPEARAPEGAHPAAGAGARRGGVARRHRLGLSRVARGEQPSLHQPNSLNEKPLVLPAGRNTRRKGLRKGEKGYLALALPVPPRAGRCGPRGERWGGRKVLGSGGARHLLLPAPPRPVAGEVCVGRTLDEPLRLRNEVTKAALQLRISPSGFVQ